MLFFENPFLRQGKVFLDQASFRNALAPEANVEGILEVSISRGLVQ
jgi:hypothetical protein